MNMVSDGGSKNKVTTNHNYQPPQNSEALSPLALKRSYDKALQNF
jgi:hypothetical protein